MSSARSRTRSHLPHNPAAAVAGAVEEAGGGDDQSETAQAGSRRPGAFGDTHVTTFDGVHYDLQAVGEFTLVRSTKDDFLVQTRQVPATGSRTASVNQRNGHAARPRHRHCHNGKRCWRFCGSTEKLSPEHYPP